MIDPSMVSIIVPHLGGSAETEYALNECIQSLIETAPDIKRIVAINGIKCDEQKHLDFNEKPFDLITIEEQGQGKACNAAIATVNTSWVFITNDDMVFCPRWFEKLVAPITENILCISPKLIEPIDGAPTFEKYFCGGAGGDFDKAKWLEFAKNYQGQGIRTGFNLPFLVKKELWDLIGGYDVNFDPFGSNGDSCLQTRIMLAGVQPYQNTNCIVYHFSGTSSTFHPDNKAYWQKNWDYYIEKYGFERASSPKIWYSQGIIDYDRLKFKSDWMGKYGEPK